MLSVSTHSLWNSEVVYKMQNSSSRKLFSCMCLCKGFFIMAVVIENLDICFAVYEGSKRMKIYQAPSYVTVGRATNPSRCLFTTEISKAKAGTSMLWAVPRVTKDKLNIQTSTQLLGVFGGKCIILSFPWQS